MDTWAAPRARQAIIVLIVLALAATLLVVASHHQTGQTAVVAGDDDDYDGGRRNPTTTTTEPEPSQELVAMIVRADGPDCWDGFCLLPWSTETPENPNYPHPANRADLTNSRLECLRNSDPGDGGITDEDYGRCWFAHVRIKADVFKTELGDGADGYSYALWEIRAIAELDDRNNAGEVLDPLAVGYERARIALTVGREGDYVDFSPRGTTEECSGGIPLSIGADLGLGKSVFGIGVEAGVGTIYQDCEQIQVRRPAVNDEPANEGLIHFGRFQVDYVSKDRTVVNNPAGQDQPRFFGLAAVIRWPTGEEEPDVDYEASISFLDPEASDDEPRYKDLGVLRDVYFLAREENSRLVRARIVNSRQSLTPGDNPPDCSNPNTPIDGEDCFVIGVSVAQIVADEGWPFPGLNRDGTRRPPG